MVLQVIKAVLLLAVLSHYHQESSASSEKSVVTQTSRAAQQSSNDVAETGPSELTKRDLSTAAEHEITISYPKASSSRVTSFRSPRNNDYSAQQMVIIKPGKVKPGHYASNQKAADKLSKRKNYDWKIPESLKGIIPETDSKTSWSYWETDDEFWPDDADDADDSKPTTTETTTMATTTTTTTTTPAPTTKAVKGPISIHKHFHYFKKAAPWKMPMPPEEVMMMTEEMMNEMMMKGMMPDSMPTPSKMPDKKGISGVLLKLSEVDPVTILVAGIIPASLILAAAIPSVMNKMMNGNKGDTTMMPPMMPPMMMMPMVTTTAMGPAMETMSSRQIPNQQLSMSELLQAVSKFGQQALKDPRCAKKRFCRLAQQSLVSDSPEFQRALQIATVAMKDSWLDALGVRDILHSLVQGTCDAEDCEWDPESDFPPVTQPTPPS